MEKISVLLDVEKFSSPSQNNILLDAFLSIKDEIIKTLQPIADKLNSSCSSIVVTLTPEEFTMRYIIKDIDLADEIHALLDEKMDLTEIADKIIGPTQN